MSAPTLRTFVIVTDVGLAYVGLHTDEDDCWQHYVGCPTGGLVTDAKARGWYCVPAEIKWQMPAANPLAVGRVLGSAEGDAMPNALRVALENLDATEPLGRTTEAVIDAAQRWYLAPKAQRKGTANAVLHTAEHLLTLLHPDTISAAKDTAGALVAMLRTQAPAPAHVAGFTDAHASYVARWGGSCRDCADENGVCPNSGLPCGGADKAIGHVFKALAYGVKHGYISNPLAAASPAVAHGLLTDADLTRARNLAHQFRSHPASRGIDDIEQAGELILSLLAAQAAGKAPAAAAPKPWPELLLLLNDYAMAMTDASQHQAASKVDIAKTQAMKALARLRAAIYGDEKSYGEVQR
ncbi:MAG: hypothetical protein ACK44A_05420 [Roseateles sp.]